jgi:hypothetical protein
MKKEPGARIQEPGGAGLTGRRCHRETRRNVRENGISGAVSGSRLPAPKLSVARYLQIHKPIKRFPSLHNRSRAGASWLLLRMSRSSSLPGPWNNRGV